MAKYKLLKQHGWYSFKEGEIYDGDYCPSICPVKDHARLSPHAWQLVKEEEIMEKTIKLSVEKARKMYGKSKEMDELLLANFSKEELEKLALPTKWEDLDIRGGYFINYQSDILYTSTSSEDDDDLIFSSEDGNENMFATIKQAKSALAMAQLSQLMKVYNGDWEPKFNGRSDIYCIGHFEHKVEPVVMQYANQFLAFKTKELRDEFLKNFEPLIKQYFIID